MAQIRPTWWTWLALALVSAGCGDVVIRKSAGPDLFDAWKSSLAKDTELSPRTQQTLRQLDLDRQYQRHPTEAAAKLHAEAVKDPRPDFLYALAEIHYVRAREAEKWSCRDSICLYYFAAGYAYHYLFATAAPSRGDGDVVPVANNQCMPQLKPCDAFDPRFRLACDLYNTSLGKCIAAAQRTGGLNPGKDMRVPTPDGNAFTLSISHAGFPWKPEEFGTLQVCEDYEVLGLANQYHTYGLGVPLIATHADKARSRYYPDGATMPVTAFFRFEGGVGDLGKQRAGRLELYNPLTVQNIRVGGKSIPLETDLTTPLAYFLAHTDLTQAAYTGFLDGAKVESKAGIQLLEPYQPGKIPVLLVHGLLSSPVTWTPLYNDLRADPVLRSRCQFWAYFYPTGNPFLIAAADLRQDLDKLRADLDPQHKDAALDQMVAIGHSMGGLVSHMLTIDSGPNDPSDPTRRLSDFWNLVSPNKPFASLKLSPETRADLERIFFFERRPCIRQVIFIATPHHGSNLSPALAGRLANQLVRLPKNLLATAHDIAENPDLPELLKGRPTSLDLLRPDSPPLQLLALRPRPTDVEFHSIIGVAPASQTRLERFLGGSAGSDPGDGVVAFRSAHLDDVSSECVVRAEHMHVHHHPLAVQEVRRILLEHCKNCEAAMSKAPN